MTIFNKKTNGQANKIALATTRKNTAENRFYLSPKNAWQLWFCQCLNIALIAPELSRWMLAIILLSFCLQALVMNRNNSKTSNKKNTVISTSQLQNKQPRNSVSPLILGVFAVLGCLAIALTAKQVGLLLSMLHLLCFSYALKAFELKARSDFYQLMLLGIFVLITALIFRQDLVFTLIAIIILAINLAVLLHFFSTEKSFVTDIKVIVIILLQSSILAVILFLVFPRLSPFWQVPIAKSAETGLSDTVKPGDIANLSRSTKLAFRADFGQQKVPAYSQLYWRAMVLENYDGRQWTRQKSSAKNRGKKSANKPFGFDVNNTQVSPLSYQVTVEPSFQKYLFALAPAVSGDRKSGIRAKSDYTFISSKIISQAKSYQLTSYLSAPLGLDLSEKSRGTNLTYPKGSNPRLEQMAVQLQRDYPEPQARAQAVLARINKENYSYTLQPPLLTNNSLDQFFFDTQAGFCVHYASAFTFLMRASGIPARLVTGYLGGEYNGSYNLDETSGEYTSKGHLSIYQYDAHAWSEIWVQDKGWMRIDPTGSVDPMRVNSGWSNELLEQQSSLNNELFSLQQWRNIAWLNSIRLQFDTLDYQWTRWVIGFSTAQQTNLFKHWFGKMSSWKVALIIAVSLLLSMVMLLLLLQFINRSKRMQQSLTQWQVVYHKALTKLAKQGLHKPAAMTVNDFSKQIRAQHPELAIVFTRLSLSYNVLSYQTLSTVEREKLTFKMQQQYKDFVQILRKQC